MGPSKDQNLVLIHIFILRDGRVEVIYLGFGHLILKMSRNKNGDLKKMASGMAMAAYLNQIEG